MYVHPDHDCVGKVFAFFVDYGFERDIDAERIFEIPPEFVSVLPFQAIKCALYNVRVKDADSEEDASDLIFDLGRKSVENIHLHFWLGIIEIQF